ncbi:hypothetical protein HAX54_007008 [Datura stramonium]|uniref:Uncharacterized protein n=1 Tax=Datura stramonium TaxID=4076 RepID=A0ABS8RV12_DATST|nr:hypothetical protein [Datura stramonium]
MLNQGNRGTNKDSSGCLWWPENHGDREDEENGAEGRSGGVLGGGRLRAGTVSMAMVARSGVGWWFGGLEIEDEGEREDEWRRRGGDCYGGSGWSSDDGSGLAGRERKAARERGERVWLFSGVAH